MQIHTFTFPAYWASAIINGDYSSLDDAEAARCKDELEALSAEGYQPASCDDEARFTWSYRLYDRGADCSGGDVLDYQFLKAREK